MSATASRGAPAPPPAPPPNVNPDSVDVGVVEAGNDLCFALETPQASRIVGDVAWEKLERNLALQSGIFGEVHLAHSTVP